MRIKFSCVVAAIDQLVLVLSISKMQNLERNIMEFESESILIIISCSLKHIGKRVMDYRLHILRGAKMSHYSLAPWLWHRQHPTQTDGPEPSEHRPSSSKLVHLLDLSVMLHQTP